MKEKVSRTIDKKIMESVRKIKALYELGSESEAMEHILSVGIFKIEAIESRKKKKVK